MQLISRCLFFVVLTAFSANVSAELSTLKKPTPRPNQISKQLMIIGQEVTRDHWPGTLPIVNAPEARKTALPGQCVTIAVVATGDERDAFLKASTFSFNIEVNGKKQSYEGLRPAVIKRIKPEGGDFVTQILGAANVKEGLPDMTSASIATFDAVWCVPSGAKDGKATIIGSARLPKGEILNFDKTILTVVSFASAIKQGTFKDKEEFGNWVTSYYRQPNPARILPACRVLANDNQAFTINMRTFLVEVLRSSPEAAKDLQERLAGESSPVRGYALHLLEKAGYDITRTIAQLPENERTQQKEFLKRIPPLPDPYDLRVDPDHFDTPQRMDGLWSIFLATGKQKSVRAIAELLTWRDDYTAVKDMQKAAVKPKSISIELGRGVCYMAAGWSLGSFVRHHRLVADFVDAWKKDASTSKVLKEELENLLENEAFKRDRGKAEQKEEAARKR